MSEKNFGFLRTFLNDLSRKIHKNIKSTDTITSALFDKQFFLEIKEMPNNIKLAFGRSLRDIKCSFTDCDNLRQHEIYIKYIAPRKLIVISANLPHSSLQEREYSSIQEVVNTFSDYVIKLSNYFFELESIDSLCTIMEPKHPTFKDDYRRILLDERTWLHIEITHDGVATNIHLIGQSEMWQDKLQQGLLRWDHDKSIVDNIMSIFDITSNNSFCGNHLSVELEGKPKEGEACGICFCFEIPGCPGIPQPICQNSNCGVHFHKFCLYQWLVTCVGGRPPAFGVANGNCPTCLQPIACSEKDS